MARFNIKTKGKVNVTTNYMGGKAFKQTAKEELIFAFLVSFIENSYYESKSDFLKRITNKIAEVVKTDPEFIAKLAIYARQKFNMRSIFHFGVSELSKVHKGDNLVRRLIKTGVVRVDDLTEIISNLSKPYPNQVKKGIADALLKFDEYQLAKYRGEGKAVSLVDVFNIVHPKPSPELVDVWKKLMNGELKSVDTWESQMTKLGQETKTDEELRKGKVEIWKDLIRRKKLGYMAALRNVRNMVETGDIELVDILCNLLTNKKLVEGSKQLPFRFLSAYKALEDMYNLIEDSEIIFEKDNKILLVEKVKEAIETALLYSIENIPLLKGKTMILSDNSGSMSGDYHNNSLTSAMSKTTTANIANLFATLYWMRADNTYVGLFGDELINPKLDRKVGLFENYNIVAEEANKCGGSTERGIFDAFRKLIKDKQIVDRIVIFSDSQLGEGQTRWFGYDGNERGSDFNSLYNQYKKINPNCVVYIVNLKSYGNIIVDDKKCLQLAGWSDKIFDVMEIWEMDEKSLIKQIEDVQI